MTGNGRRDHMEKPLLGAVLCCTAVPPEERTRYADIVKEMGGEHKLDLTSDVTHLLVEVSDALTAAHLTAKYKYVAANREDVRVLQPAWLEAVRQSWMTAEKFDLQALEEEYKLPIFAGLSVCLTGFDDLAFRAQLQARIIAHGGDYRGDLTKSVTHLIANAPEGKKYQYAEQWQVRVVSLRWFKDCLDRGMVLEETLYHPTLPLEEQGKGAWNREAKAQVQLGKHPRDEMTPREAPRKLRWTASSKLGSQSDDLWGDIMGGGFDTGPDPELPVRPSKSRSDVKSVVLERESFVTGDTGTNRHSAPLQGVNPRPLNAPPEVNQGYFFDQVFLVHGFPPKNKSLLRDVLTANGAFLVDSLIDMNELPDMVRGLFVIVPYSLPRIDIPSLEAVHPTPRVVTDMWIERCLAYKAYSDPDEHPASTPVGIFPLDEFVGLTINSTGFEGVDLLHIAKLVRLVGAKYDETLHPKISVLICNKPKANSEKQRYAHSWGAPVVSDMWFWVCLRGGRLESVDSYVVPGFHNMGTVGNGSSAGRQLREGIKEKEDASKDAWTERLREDQYTARSVRGSLTSERRKDSGQTNNRPGADFLEEPAPPPTQQEDRRGRDGRVSKNPENHKRSSTAQLSRHPDLDEALPLQEISTNSPPKKKKSLFRSLDGNGSVSSTAMSEDPAPIAPAPTSTGKTEYVPPQTDSINEAIHDLLNMTSKARSSAPSIGEGATKKTRLLGRAMSTISNSSRQSRASSVDSMNTDGVGSVVGAEPSQSGKPRGIGRAGSLKGRATGRAIATNALPFDLADSGPSRDEFADEEPTPPMTQLGYGEHEDAIKIREKLAEKRRGRSRQTQETIPAATAEKKIKDDDAILGVGWGAGRRTRHRERSPKGMEAF